MNEDVVRIYMRSGKDKRLVSETDMRLFKANMKIHGRPDRYFIVFGTPEGGAELDIPREFGKDLIETMLAMMDPGDVKEIMRATAERMN